MKIAIIAIGFLFLAILISARDIDTLDGKSYKDIKIRQAKPNGIEIIHSKGVAFLQFDNLSPEIQKEFNYSKEDAGKYVQENDIKVAQAMINQYTKELAQAQKELEEKDKVLTKMEGDINSNVSNFNSTLDRRNKIVDSTFITKTTKTTEIEGQSVRVDDGYSTSRGYISPTTATTTEESVSRPATDVDAMDNALNATGAKIDKMNKTYKEVSKEFDLLIKKRDELAGKLDKAKKTYDTLVKNKEIAEASKLEKETLESKLTKLKDAFSKGLITKEAYDSRVSEIVNEHIK